ncbi:hypothetical protein NDU88_001195 [Pleurodeles waltl]|uniref:Uncharacterized protein n=1 Tax=Pleurodeles waltl TaxID=8319 RepID=A0AAV7UW63_PLEWA|nr:hypothetical protein NDU88_001195 [Pleurodeles waltl]
MPPSGCGCGWPRPPELSGSSLIRGLIRAGGQGQPDPRAPVPGFCFITCNNYFKEMHLVFLVPVSPDCGDYCFFPQICKLVRIAK